MSEFGRWPRAHRLGFDEAGGALYDETGDAALVVTHSAVAVQGSRLLQTGAMQTITQTQVVAGAGTVTFSANLVQLLGDGSAINNRVKKATKAAVIGQVIAVYLNPLSYQLGLAHWDGSPIQPVAGAAAAPFWLSGGGDVNTENTFQFFYDGTWWRQLGAAG